MQFSYLFNIYNIIVLAAYCSNGSYAKTTSGNEEWMNCKTICSTKATVCGDKQTDGNLDECQQPLIDCFQNCDALHYN
eukprot:Pgem_evm1s649